MKDYLKFVLFIYSLHSRLYRFLTLLTFIIAVATMVAYSHEGFWKSFLYSTLYSLPTSLWATYLGHREMKRIKEDFSPGPVRRKP